jgi:glycine/D-amino acid oxidase-like deaminating enzyme
VDAARIRELVPQLAPIYARGVLVPDQGVVANPERLTKALAAQFQKDGGAILKAQGARHRGRRRRRHGPEDRCRAHAGETLVVCGGVHSGELTAKLGEPVPIEAERGYHVTYSDPGLQLSMPISISEAKAFVTPMEMGVRIAGQAEFAGIYADPTTGARSAGAAHEAHVSESAPRGQDAVDGAAACHAGFTAGHRTLGEAAQRVLRVRARAPGAVRWRADGAADRRPAGGTEAGNRSRAVPGRPVLTSFAVTTLRW